MLTVLFVLEFNFELKPNRTLVFETLPTFNLQVPTNFKIITEQKPIAFKPVVQNAIFKNLIKATTEEVPTEEIIPNENVVLSETENPTESENPTETLIKSANPIVPAENTLFNVEEVPMFPACKGLSKDQQMKCFEEQLAKEVARNAVYPGEDLENSKQGRAFISFIIDETGKIVQVKAAENKYASFAMQKAEEAAVRKVSKLTPAKQGGKSVRIKYTIPVTFRIQQQK